MGTNYYLYEVSKVCPTCGHSAETPLHIGKYSVGWVFALHIYPEKGIKGLSDWVKLFHSPGQVIRDGYGKGPILPEDLIQLITGEGCSQVGRRREVDGEFCVAHGPGNWDLCKGDFS